MRGGREAIIITELPYQVNKASLIEKISELSATKKIAGISEIRDESNREGIRGGARARPRRNPTNRDEPALQAHADADHVRHHHAGAGRPAAAGRQSQGDARGVRALPPRDRHAADALRPGPGRGTGARAGGAPEGRRAARPGHPADPAGREPRRRARGADDAARAVRDPGARDPRHAAAAADPARAAQGRRGARADAGPHRGAEGHPRLRREADGDHPGGAPGDQGGVRRRPAHGDPHRDHRADDRGPPGRRGDGRHHLAGRLHQARRTSRRIGASAGAARA